jgi:uncharacterized cupredoxin-like copper-binding protein
LLLETDLLTYKQFDCSVFHKRTINKLPSNFKRIFLTMTKKGMLIFSVFMLMGMLIVACGGDSSSTVPEPTQLTFVGDDSLAFSPTSATATANQKVEVTVENEGTLEHNWILVDRSIEPTEVEESDAIGGANSGLVAGGDSLTFSFTAPPAGTYQYVCIVEGHAAAGMVGTLTVQ